jgi:hypothetical protein
MPANIALDTYYIKELQRRAIWGFPEQRQFLRDLDQRIIADAENPIISIPKPIDLKAPKAVQNCLERKSRSSTPQ